MHLRPALTLFIATRLLLTLWSLLVLTAVSPTLATNLWLDPWQQFDTGYYLLLATNGYTQEAASVFPPLYPLLIRLLSTLLGGRFLLAALLIANSAALALFYWLHRLASRHLSPSAASHSLFYLALFPTSFFLFAGYTEPLFLLLVVTSLWFGENGRFAPAALLAFLAALTRLNGWLLIFPLAIQLWQHSHPNWPRLRHTALLLLPPLAPALFLGYRAWLGLPSLATVYANHWYQTTGVPGRDVLTAVSTLCCGGSARAGEFTLLFDLLITLLLAASSWATWRRFGPVYGSYMVTMLLFILLPTSPVKPLYSFSRYALAFFPLFWLLGAWSEKRPLRHRLILYPFFLLLLYFSGQFLLGGWVA